MDGIAMLNGHVICLQPLIQHSHQFRLNDKQTISNWLFNSQSTEVGTSEITAEDGQSWDWFYYAAL